MNAMRIPGILLVMAASAAAVFLYTSHLAETLGAVLHEREAEAAAYALERIIDAVELNRQELDQVRSTRIEELRDRLKALVDIAYGLVDHHHQQAAARRMSERQAQRQALDMLRVLRYDNERYFWADTVDYQVLVLPRHEREEGRNWEHVTDAKGMPFAKELVDRAVAAGDVFLVYHLPRAETGEIVAKQGYARHFAAWDWIIGSSIHLDELDREIEGLRRDWMTELGSRLLSHGAYLPFIFDEHGTAVLSADGPLPELAELDRAGRTHIGSGRDRMIVQSARIADLGWTIVLAKPLADLAEPLEALRRAAVLPSLVFALAAGLACLLLGAPRKLLRAQASRTNGPSIAGPSRPIAVEGPDQASAGPAEPAAPAGTPRDEPCKGPDAGTPHSEPSAETRETVLLRERVAVLSESLQSADREAGDAVRRRVEEILPDLRRLAAPLRIAEGGGELHASFHRLQEAADCGQESMEEAARTAEDEITRLEDVLDETRSIVRDVSAVPEMVELMDEVTDRINMLAMNAAIEAAHAGEAGRGFAVIASEIRRLADESAENVARISDSLKKTIDNAGTIAAVSEQSSAGLRRSLERLHATLESQRRLREAAGDLAGLIKGMDQRQAIKDESLHRIEKALAGLGEEIKSNRKYLNIE